jgi:hypothetical protein
LPAQYKFKILKAKTSFNNSITSKPVAEKIMQPEDYHYQKAMRVQALVTAREREREREKRANFRFQ